MGAPSPVLRALVEGAIDYAGLFPPAGLSMEEAVASYASYRVAVDRWMLGRFVVPVARIDELAAAVTRHPHGAGSPWPVAALVGEDAVSDAARVAELREAHSPLLRIESVEMKASTTDAVERAARAFAGTTLFLEIPIVHDPRALLRAIAAVGVHAKVRTGGVTVESFPSTVQLARFIATCVDAEVSFKATAGLHHPLRGEHRLTNDLDAPVGTMFGFLNVFAAAAFARDGMNESLLAELLEERDPAALRFEQDALQWGRHVVSLARPGAARSSLAIAFGSCSFVDPVDDLHSLALL